MSENTGKAACPARQDMPQQEAHKRIYNFDEVALGYTPEMALTEASRCLECKQPRCVAGCPVAVDIPGFIGLVKKGEFAAAARKIKKTNALPAICGRVCPQETQCEQLCVRGVKGEPVAVGRLERFVADYEREQGQVETPALAPRTGKRVAIVGSGPAGLAAAADLARAGHEVVVLEALHEVGGVLVYGIPEFRLPKAIVRAEVDYLCALGVEFRTSFVVGKIQTIDELLEEYDAIFIGTGAGLPKFLGVEGEDLLGVGSANEYLTRANLMKAHHADADTPIFRGQRVITVGGGNVAMDAARTAKRLGAEQSIIVYRRTFEEMPARLEERHHAQEEGIEFHLLSAPVAFLGDADLRLRAVVIQKMELGEPDASGRRSPVPIAGSEFEMPVDIAIIAVGTGANPLISGSTPGLGLSKRGYIVADETTGATNLPRVFAGGDIVTGAATVIEAMGAGRKAAAAINECLKG